MDRRTSLIGSWRPIPLVSLSSPPCPLHSAVTIRPKYTTLDANPGSGHAFSRPY